MSLRDIVVAWVNVMYPRKREYMKDSPGSSAPKRNISFRFGKDVSPESCGYSPLGGYSPFRARGHSAGERSPLGTPALQTRREAVGACCLFPANKDAAGGDTETPNSSLLTPH